MVIKKIKKIFNFIKIKKKKVVKLTKKRTITRIHFINSKYCVITPKKFVTRYYAVNLCVAGFPGCVFFTARINSKIEQIEKYYEKGKSDHENDGNNTACCFERISDGIFDILCLFVFFQRIKCLFTKI
jgi:hypothetical protein